MNFARHLYRQLNTLFSEAQKRRLRILFAVMIPGALLEALGVSFIVPFVAAITREASGEAGAPGLPGGLYRLDRFFRIPLSPGSLLLLLMAIFIAKAVYLAAEYRMQAAFIADCRLETQDRMVRACLGKNYSFYLDRNSSDFHKTLVIDLNKVFQVLQQTLAMLIELTVSLLLLITLFLIDPLMTFCVLVLISAAVIAVGGLIRPRLHDAGNAVMGYERDRNRWITQGFAGIKEIKHMHAEEYLAERIHASGEGVRDAEKTRQILGNTPKLLIETVCICGMLAVLAGMLSAGRTAGTLLPSVSAFAMAAIKLMPGANKVTTAMAAIVYNMPALDRVTEVLAAEKTAEKTAEDAAEPAGNGPDTDESGENADAGRPGRMPPGCDIIFRNVSYAYPGTGRKILDRVSLQVPGGTMIGITGASGAGKTTFADLIMGLLTPDEGEVVTSGRRIGYIPQSTFMLDDTVRVNVAFGVPRGEIDDERVWECLKEARIADHIRSLPDGLAARVGERGIRLSGGQVQRIGIARALYGNPDILIFDEATSALDRETEMALIESVNQMHGKRTMVIIAHKSAALRDCDMVFRVEDGKISEALPGTDAPERQRTL